jgi:hypothetical protein
MNREEILKKTMLQMPRVFTSNQFNTVAIKNGFPKEILKKKGLAKFIEQYASNGSFQSKTWVKFTEEKTVMNEAQQSNSEDKRELSDRLQEAIELLKGNGYKILKVHSEWVEI